MIKNQKENVDIKQERLFAAEDISLKEELEEDKTDEMLKELIKLYLNMKFIIR